MKNLKTGKPVHRIETKAAPEALGPYSQAISVDVKNSQLLFVSGQLPIDPKNGNLIADDIKKAANQVLDNIQAILEAADCAFSHVVRVDIFLKDLNDFQAVNGEYKKRFTGNHLPARQTIQAAKLPLDSPVEISCIAVRELS